MRRVDDLVLAGVVDVQGLSRDRVRHAVPPSPGCRLLRRRRVRGQFGGEGRGLADLPQGLHDARGASPVAPAHAVHRQDDRALGGMLEDVAREVEGLHLAVGLGHGRGLSRHADAAHQGVEAAEHGRLVPAAEAPDRGGARDDDHRVPDPALLAQQSGILLVGLLAEDAHAAGAALGDGLAGDDPAVVGLRAVGARGHQDQVVGEALGEQEGFLQEGVEPVVREDEMVARHHDHDRVGVLGQHAGQGEEDAGAGVARLRLHDDGAGNAHQARLVKVRHVIGRDDGHHAPGARDGRGAVQGVLDHRARAGEGAVLLGERAAQPALDEGLHPGALASGQDDGPAGADAGILLPGGERLPWSEEGRRDRHRVLGECRFAYLQIVATARPLVHRRDRSFGP